MKLTENDFITIAIRAYDNPTCKTLEEFEADLSRFKYLRKLLIRYANKDDVSVRLMLNHVVLLFNAFKRDDCIKLLFLKTEPQFWSQIKTFLVFLSYMPDFIPELGVINSDIPLDQIIIDELRTL
jgi:hypothetical protein